MKLTSFLRAGGFSSPGVLIVLTIAMLMLFVTGPSSVTGITTRATQDSGQPNPAKKKISFESSVPKEIKILKLRNYDDDNWFETFECEIENRSEKNIVYIYFQILLPQFDVENRRVAFTMEFGRPKAEEADNPSTPMLRPGDKYLFKIPPHQVENLRRYSTDSTAVPRITAISFEFYMIWFSDRTGYVKAKPIVVQPDGKLPFVIPNRLQSASPPSNSNPTKGRTLPTRVGLRAGSGFFLDSRTSPPIDNASGAAYWCEGQTGNAECGNYSNYQNYCIVAAFYNCTGCELVGGTYTCPRQNFQTQSGAPCVKVVAIDNLACSGSPCQNNQLQPCECAPPNCQRSPEFPPFRSLKNPPFAVST